MRRRPTRSGWSAVADGVALQSGGHRVRLKWHRLKRERSDPVFTGARLAEGLALGASMEVDLRVHAGGGLVVLHEPSLDHETTGTGLIADASPEYLRSLRIRGEDGAPTDDPVLLLEDLTGLMRRDAAPGALVQLDFKETLASLTPTTAAAFGRAVADLGDKIILSAGDWAAVNRLAETAAGMLRGFDPCDLPEASRLASAADVAGFVALTGRIATEADFIYLSYPLILHCLDLGHDIVGAFHDEGQKVDAWTLNTDHPDAANSLRRLVGCGVDQITTDEPRKLEELWREVGT